MTMEKNISATQNNSVSFDIDIDTETFILPVSFIGILTVFGFLGNLLVLIIFGRKKTKRTHTIFILGLVVSDFLVCSITLPFEIYETMNTFTFVSGAMCKIFRTYNYFVVSWSTFILIFLSVDRYRRVCQPLKGQLNSKTAYVLIFTALMISLSISWPQMFLQGITTTLLDNKIRHQCTVSEEYVGMTYAVFYFYLIMAIAIINIMTIIVLYTLIGRRIVLHMRYRNRFHAPKKVQSMNSQNSKDLELRRFSIVEQSSAFTSDGRYSTPVIRDESFTYRITKIAFAIGISFVISYVPSVFLSLTEATLGKDYTKNFGSTSIAFVILAEKSFAINHVVNPFIYGFLDIAFRNKCKILFKSTTEHFKCRKKTVWRSKLPITRCQT